MLRMPKAYRMRFFRLNPVLLELFPRCNMDLLAEKIPDASFVAPFFSPLRM